MAATQPTAQDQSEIDSTSYWTRHHEVVSRAVQIVTRTRRLTTTEAEDLHSEVWVKLLSSPRAGTRFDGRSALVTYLVSIAKNVLLDMRIKERGKWRPTARSRHLGPVAVELDRLVRRDGHGASEAVATLRSKGMVLHQGLIDAIASSRPCRSRVAPSVLDRLPSAVPMPDQILVTSEDARVATQAVTTLARALGKMPREDRILLHRRFVKGHTVATIAGGDRHLQKQLYRRIDRALAQLRAMVEGEGVQRRQIAGLLLGDLTNVECGIGFVGRALNTP